MESLIDWLRPTSSKPNSSSGSLVCEHWKWLVDIRYSPLAPGPVSNGPQVSFLQIGHLDGRRDEKRVRCKNFTPHVILSSYKNYADCRLGEGTSIAGWTGSLTCFIITPSLSRHFKLLKTGSGSSKTLRTGSTPVANKSIRIIDIFGCACVGAEGVTYIFKLN